VRCNADEDDKAGTFAEGYAYTAPAAAAVMLEQAKPVRNGLRWPGLPRRPGYTGTTGLIHGNHYKIVLRWLVELRRAKRCRKPLRTAKINLRFSLVTLAIHEARMLHYERTGYVV
jgi:hypothetical protein